MKYKLKPKEKKRTAIYRCSCGHWSRREFKTLTNGQAICSCGAVMKRGYKMLSAIANFTEIGLLMFTAKPIKTIGDEFTKRHEFMFAKEMK